MILKYAAFWLFREQQSRILNVFMAAVKKSVLSKHTQHMLK